jgi:pectinesterase
VFSGGSLIVSKNYTTLRMLGNGPIRFSFEVSYAPWDANGIEVSEMKRITLDAGTHMNRIESTYTFQGGRALHLAAAIAVHAGASAEFPVEGSIASVWDTPQDPSAGRIATGLVALPGEHARTIEAAGHAVMLFTRHSGEPFTYLAGSGWSKAEMSTAADWNSYLRLQLQMLQHPILVQWARR